MARGRSRELTAIAEPDVGVIVNVGPVHLELLGSIEAIAAAKAELIAGIASGATVVVPADEPLLEPHRRADVRTITFGEGGDVELEEQARPGEVMIRHGTQRMTLRPSFTQAHNLSNLLAAVAAARALGVTPEGDLEVRFSALRGERIALARRDRFGQRLLQRQPDVHARRDRGLDENRNGAPGGRAGRHARARPRGRAWPAPRGGRVREHAWRRSYS